MRIPAPKSNSLGYNNAASRGCTFRLSLLSYILYLCPIPFLSVSLFWCQRSKDPHRKSFSTRVYMARVAFMARDSIHTTLLCYLFHESIAAHFSAVCFT